MIDLPDVHIYGGLIVLAVGLGLFHIGLGIAAFGAGLIVLGALYAVRAAQTPDEPSEEA